MRVPVHKTTCLAVDSYSWPVFLSVLRLLFFHIETFLVLFFPAKRAGISSDASLVLAVLGGVTETIAAVALALNIAEKYNSQACSCLPIVNMMTSSICSNLIALPTK